MGKKSKKYYAVKIGLVPGLYLTWGECQQNINGFSGAVYKSFDTQEEAEQFLSGDVGSGKETDSVKRIYTDSEAVAYVRIRMNMLMGQSFFMMVEKNISQKSSMITIWLK